MSIRDPIKFEITNEEILAAKQDIIDFKKESPLYMFVDWMHSKGTVRDEFVLDYMKSRGLTEGFGFYDQMTYIVMCAGWTIPKMGNP